MKGTSRKALIAAFRWDRNSPVAGNQARGAVSTKIIAGPLDQNQYLVFELDQFDEMNEQPCEPGGKAGKVKSAEIRDRRCSADDCHITSVAVVKRRQAPAFEPVSDHFGRVTPFLNGNRRR